MDPRYQHYSVNDFDAFDCLKLSKGVYAIVLFMLRAYVVWAISVASFDNKTALLSLFFPDKKLFYLNLLSGVLGLLILFILSNRKPKAAAWIQTCWPKTRLIMVAALLFDMSVMLLAYTYQLFHSLPWLILQIALVCCFICYLYTSKRLAINLTEFPQTFEDK